MSRLIAGIGEWVVSNQNDNTLHTYALGSCCAVILQDSKSLTTGLIHIALPESKSNAEKAKTLPGYFADTGIPILLKEIRDKGVSTPPNRLRVKIAGGANISDTKGIFNIGKRNILAVKKTLWQLGLAPIAEDIGGSINRTIAVHIDSGEITVTSSQRPPQKL